MYGVSKISTEQDIMLISFTDIELTKHYPSKVLACFAENFIVVDMISQTAPKSNTSCFCFTVSHTFFDNVIKALPCIKKVTNNNPPLLSYDYTKINLYGKDMLNSCGVCASALSTLAENNIEIVMITTSDLDISILINNKDEDLAIKVLKDKFNL